MPGRSNWPKGHEDANVRETVRDKAAMKRGAKEPGGNGNLSASPASSLRRKRAYRHGHFAETLAILWLRLHFYRILDRRFHVRGGEIDIIARRGETVAFIEVKARATLDEALLAIDAAKRRRMGFAVRTWLARHPSAMTCTLRGDALCIAPWRLPRHLPAAIPLDID